MTLVLNPVDNSEPLVFNGFRCIVAGYTGRERGQVQHHIDELAAIGVAPHRRYRCFTGCPSAPPDHRREDQRAPASTPPVRSSRC